MLIRCCLIIVGIISVARGSVHYDVNEFGPPELCATKRESGAAVACDENGLYAAKQCNVTSGACWCVVPQTGVKLPGSTSSDGTTLNCSDLTACQRAFEEAEQFIFENPYIADYSGPSCGEDGLYTVWQCEWMGCTCVVPETGNIIPGFEDVNDRNPLYLSDWRRKSSKRFNCEDSCPRKRQKDATIQCDIDGLFAAKQCDVTSGACWCVAPQTGRKIPGSSHADGAMLNCSDLTPCQNAYLRVEKHSVSRFPNANQAWMTYVTCREEDGHFEIEQCEVYVHACTCVVPETGNPIPGLQFIQSDDLHSCDYSCPKKRQSDAQVSCEENGWYSEKQCNASSGACWCVVPQTGHEIPGTKTAEGIAPNCADFKPCQESYINSDAWRYANEVFGPNPAYSCRDDGHYRSKRCGPGRGGPGSPRVCRCIVPENGMELPGHGPSIDCDNLTPCQRMWRDASLQAPPRQPSGHIMAPQMTLTMCDDDGNFDSVRCDFANNTCWCASPDTGEKVNGSLVATVASWPEDEAEVRRQLACAVPKCQGAKVFEWIPAHECELWCEDLGRWPGCGGNSYPQGKCICPPDAPYADGDSCYAKSECLAKRCKIELNKLFEECNTGCQGHYSLRYCQDHYRRRFRRFCDGETSRNCTPSCDCPLQHAMNRKGVCVPLEECSIQQGSKGSDTE